MDYYDAVLVELDIKQWEDAHMRDDLIMELDRITDAIKAEAEWHADYLSDSEHDEEWVRGKLANLKDILRELKQL